MDLPRTALAILAAATLAGCNLIPPAQPDTTRFFVLNTGASASALQAVNPPLRIGLLPVEPAPYLRTRSFVIRRDANEVVFNDGLRWAEPLEASVTRAVAARLAATPGVTRLDRHPFPLDDGRDLEIRILLDRCEGDLSAGPRAALAARIELLSTAPGRPVLSRVRYDFPGDAWDGRDPAALAAALGRAVDALADEVVRSLPR